MLSTVSSPPSHTSHRPQVPPSDVAAFREIRTEPEWFVYEGAQHGFDNATRPVRYHADAAALARTRTLAFLDRLNNG